jgi:hypothetical protein
MATARFHRDQLDPAGGGMVAACAEHLVRYWSESSRPLVSLVFVAPMLVAYEGGLFMLGPHAMRTGADIWLRRLLELMGFSQYFLLPLLTCGVLLSWHHLTRDRWAIGWATVYGMLLESVVLGATLLVVAHWQTRVWLPEFSFSSAVLSAGAEVHGAGRLVAYLGAGIYEELLFRLLLMPLIFAALRAVGVDSRVSLAGTVAIGSLIFSAAHYQFDLDFGAVQWSWHAGEPFEWLSFGFRVVAGAFFSLLFWYRGFGVAAGTHALYDILVADW